MKANHFILLVCFATITSLMQAQTLSANDWNQERLLTEKKAMVELSVWGGANLTLGTALALTSEKHELRYMHAMNAGIGLFNAGFGLIGISRVKKDQKREMSLQEGYRDLRKMRKRLLINSGLDVGSILAGVLLRQGNFSENSQEGRNRRKGFGTSIIIQGVAQLIYDTSTARSLLKSELQITPVITPNGAGIGFQTDFNKERPVGVAWF